jgi:hypothetical protein
MSQSIKTTFDSYCRDLKIDSKLSQNIRAYDATFVTKNSDHISFFGSGLLGVYPIKWLDADRDRWFDDVLEADDLGLSEDIFNLPSVDRNHKVASDVTNLSFVYLIHKLHNSELTDTMIKDASISVIRILHYKFISSILSAYFKYVADEAVAKEAYSSLSQKFDIKRLGTWGALINARAEHLISKDSIHVRRGTFDKMDDDEDVQYVLTDTQSRIRELIKVYTGVFHAVRAEDGRVISTSNVLQVEDGMVIRDVRRAYNQYHTYIKKIIVDDTDFIRYDLVKVIEDAIPSIDPKVFSLCLQYLSANYLDKRRSYVAEFVDDSMMYAFEFMFQRRMKTSDLAAVLTRLRSMYTGSRINDSEILKLRSVGDKIVREASHRKHSVPTAPERTGLLLYIILRALTMNHWKVA